MPLRNPELRSLSGQKRYEPPHKFNLNLRRTIRTTMKKEEIYFDTVELFNEYYGFETLHPLVSVVRYDRPRAIRAATYHYGLYALFLK